MKPKYYRTKTHKEIVKAHNGEYIYLTGLYKGEEYVRDKNLMKIYLGRGHVKEISEEEAFLEVL